MLTRYEELFIKERDEHGRFPAKASIAYKYNFLDRPIVDEYAEIIFRNLPKKKQKPEVIFTHDVDKITKTKWEAVKTEIKNVLRLRLSGIPGMFYHLLNKKNPADTFDFIEETEKNQRRIYFLLNMSEDGYAVDSPEIKQLAVKLTRNGAEIGWHKDRPDKTKPETLSSSRNHFLLFDADKTWDMLNDMGVKKDYTIGYADSLGFRAGTCHFFQVFSIKRGHLIELVEHPLTMMDVTLYAYLRLNPAEAWREFIKYAEIIKKYNGIFVLLWHNFSFDELRWRKFYKKVVNFLVNSYNK